MVNPAVLRDLFDRAVSLPPADRAAFIAHACGTDAALREQLLRLLAAGGRDPSIFDTSSAAASQRANTSPSTSEPPGIAAGTRLGPYEVVGAAGHGGMGEVYRARDTRLGRIVALKVLPADVSHDPIARQRLEREARAIAALSHPHICPLFDVGRDGDVDYLVMEYLQGETLAARLRRGPLPLREALTVANQVASGLTAAHRAAIVHRDLKPGNVMLTESGARLLDFGLARSAVQETANESTLSVPEPLTGTGMILGTLPYMAPEQIEGQPVDARTDIFAFGVVLYETVTGRRAFESTSQAALAGQILRDDPPPLISVDASLPVALDRLIRHCMAKAPADRLQTMAEVQARLEALREESASTIAPGPIVRRRFWWGAAGALGALLALLSGAAWWRWPAAATTQNTRATTRQSPAQRTLTRLTFEQGLQTDPSFSPDGRMMAYASDRAGNFDVYVQQLAGGDPVQVTRSPSHDSQPSWSPDGNTLAFRSERDSGGIYLVPSLGGRERRLSTTGSRPSWSADGSEVFYVIEPLGNTSAILRAVNVATGVTRDVFPEFQRTGWWKWIDVRSDGRVSFLGSRRQKLGFFTVSSAGVTTSDFSTVSASLDTVFGGQSSIFGDVRFEWNPDSTELLLQTRSRDGLTNLWNVKVDVATLAWTGVERLTTGAGSFVAGTFAPGGGRRIAFSLQQESEQLWEYAVTKTGLTQGRALTEVGATIRGADVSSHGNAIVFQLLRPGSTSAPTFWTIRSGQAASELTGMAGLFTTRLSPDGTSIAYLKLRSTPGRTFQTGGFEAAIAITAADGAERQLGPWEDGYRSPCDWSPDGRSLLTGGPELRQWPLNGSPARDESRVVLDAAEGNLWEARYSPNGKWLAFVNSQIPSAPDRAVVGVTTAEGAHGRAWTSITADKPWVDKPRWRADGKALYVLASREGVYLDVWQVPFDPERGVPTGPAIQLTHFNSPGFHVSRSLSTTGWGTAGSKAWLTMRTATGNIWALEDVLH